MTATATKPRTKKHHGVYHRDGYAPSPDATGTTTPAGIAANDPDAGDFDRWKRSWEQLRPIVNRIVTLAGVDPTNHLEASALLSIDPQPKWLPTHISRARALIEKVFPGELSAGPAPPDENLTQSRGGAESDDSMGALVAKMRAENGQAKKPARALEPIDFNNAGLSDDSAIVILAVNELERHPDNRHPQKPEIEDLARSLQSDGQLEAIVVRRRPGQAKLQILSGETRWLATKHLRYDTIRGRVIECDDARALQIVALGNAKRKDLDPIQKAKLIERLCDSIDQGGAGMTREQAANMYGMESGAAASNLVRLLELPKIWQDRVASGELPWTWARELLPVVKLKPVMAALEEDWKQRGTMQWADEDTFLHRENVIQGVRHHLGEECRRLDEMHYANGQHRRLQIDAGNAAVREQLGIVEVQIPGGKKGKSETVEVATNVKAFDAMLQKQTARATKASAEKAGRDAPPPKRELTPAQKKALAKKQADELARRIDGWRHAWLKSRIAAGLAEDEQLREWVLVAIAAQEIRPRSDSHEAIEAVAKQGMCRLHSNAFETLGKLADSDAIFEAGTELARNALLEPDSDPRYPAIPFRHVDLLAAKAGLDLSAEWQRLQNGQNHSAAEDRDRFEAFFLLHQTAQLDSLGNELGVHVEHVSGKAAKIKLLTNCPRTLKLPKSIKPVAGVAKGKTAKQKALRAGRS